MLPYDRVADELQALLPLLDLPHGYIPAGQGSVVLDLVGKAQDRDRVPGTHLGNAACAENLIRPGGRSYPVSAEAG